MGKVDCLKCSVRRGFVLTDELACDLTYGRQELRHVMINTPH